MINYGQIKYENIRELNIQLDDFKKGVNKLLRDTRLKKEETAEAKNLMLVQDGLWTKRWGTAQYGGDFGGDSIDGFAEYRKTDGTRELIVVSDGKVWKKNGDSKTEITGATFTEGITAFLLQINDRLYITNGTDSLAYYDGSTLSTYTALSAPDWAGTPLTRGAGLSAGNYTQYYVVTALNDVGETVGSTEESITTDLERLTWAEADEYIDLDWDAVNGASRYQVYWGDESGFETLLASTTDTSFRDDGSLVVNPYIEIPDDDTTGAPKFTYMWLSDNRIWATGDPDNVYRVYFSGAGQFIGFFSDFYGGGWVDLEKGGRHTPKAGIQYHDGKGVSRTTVFASTSEGRGSVWQVALGEITVGDETFIIPSASKIVGSVGTDSPKSVVQVENDVYFFNKRGVFVLGNEAQYWGILRTNELSVPIRPFIESLNDTQLEGVCSFYHDGKVFFSVPTNADGNNRIFYYDRERRAWVTEWTIGVSQFGEFTDSNDVTHLLGGQVGDGFLIEFSSNYHGDSGVAFETTYLSPRISVDKDWTKFAKIKKAWIRLGEPEGAINFSIIGTEKRRGYSTLASDTISPEFSNTGLGWDMLGSVQLGDTDGTPTSFAQGSLLRYKTVNKRLRDIQFKIETETLQSKYTLLGLQATGFPIETRPPSGEKL